MRDEPGYLVVGRCFACGNVFTFNPHLVPSVPIDPMTKLPPDVGKTDPVRAVREPLCERCVSILNRRRAEEGREPLIVLAGAYEPMAGLPE